MTTVPTDPQNIAANADVQSAEALAAATEQPTEPQVAETTECEATETVPEATAPDTVTETPTEETVTPEEANEEPDEEAIEAERPIAIPETKEGIVARLDELAQNPEQSTKPELDMLKQGFYRLITETATQAYQNYIAEGGQPEAYQPTPDPLEAQFKQNMSIIKAFRAKIFEETERVKQANLKKKQLIIEEMKQLAVTPEDAGKNFAAFRKLQADWREINPVPAQNNAELWRTYQVVTETFYDLLKENDAMRNYDFKKNLEAKTRICEEAEKLVELEDAVSAATQLQMLFQSYREIGPVAKEEREAIWQRFHAAQTTINRRNAQYFQTLRAKEEENYEQKAALCEQAEAIQTDALQSVSDWNQAAQSVITLQQTWRTIGHAPKKKNAKIYERFTAACEAFFKARTEFYSTRKKNLAQVMEELKAMAEEVEALKESTNWQSTAAKIQKIRDEFRTKAGQFYRPTEAIRTRFYDACNYFFDRRKAALGEQYKEQNENYKQKASIVARLEALLTEPGESVAETVKALMAEWNTIGLVPYKKKEELFQKYHEAVDRLYKAYNLRQQRRQSAPRRNESRQQSYQDAQPNTLYRLYENKKAEIATYENNISFLTANSKRGNSLIDDIRARIETLKAELADIVSKIQAHEAAEAAPEATNETEATAAE